MQAAWRARQSRARSALYLLLPTPNDLPHTTIGRGPTYTPSPLSLVSSHSTFFLFVTFLEFVIQYKRSHASCTMRESGCCVQCPPSRWYWNNQISRGGELCGNPPCPRRGKCKLLQTISEHHFKAAFAVNRCRRPVRLINQSRPR